MKVPQAIECLELMVNELKQIEDKDKEIYIQINNLVIYNPFRFLSNLSLKNEENRKHEGIIITYGEKKPLQEIKNPIGIK